MIFVSVDDDWRVRLLAEIELARPASLVWQVMSNFEKFTTCDPFHTRVRTIGDPAVTGTGIEIVHGFFGFGLTRVGRILRWEEGVGYSMSDLSRSGMTRGFPHIYGYRLQSLPGDCCRLSVSVRGKWTMRWPGRWVVTGWLTGVMWLIEAMLRRRLARV